jgi:nicotinamidase-related amidase
MNKALILIDIQNDYFENGAMELVDAEKASNNAKLVLEKFRKEQIPVIHIQHIANRPGATFFIPKTEGAEIHKVVKPIAKEKVIVKHFPNSFRETELWEYLKSKNITDLVICGMMTHMCVDSTTRAAKDLGYNCVVIGDACATRDLDLNGVKAKAIDVQTTILAALSNYYSTIKMTEQYLERE